MNFRDKNKMEKFIFHYFPNYFPYSYIWGIKFNCDLLQ